MKDSGRVCHKNPKNVSLMLQSFSSVSDAGYVSLETVSLINSREKERKPVLSGQTLLILVMLNAGSMKDGRGYHHTTHWFMSRYEASSRVLLLLPPSSSLIGSDKQSVHLTVKLHTHWLMMCDSEGFRFFFINMYTTTQPLCSSVFI